MSFNDDKDKPVPPIITDLEYDICIALCDCLSVNIEEFVIRLQLVPSDVDHTSFTFTESVYPPNKIR